MPDGSEFQTGLKVISQIAPNFQIKSNAVQHKAAGNYHSSLIIVMYVV